MRVVCSARRAAAAPARRDDSAHDRGRRSDHHRPVSVSTAKAGRAPPSWATLAHSASAGCPTGVVVEDVAQETGSERGQSVGRETAKRSERARASRIAGHERGRLRSYSAALTTQAGVRDLLTAADPQILAAMARFGTKPKAGAVPLAAAQTTASQTEKSCPARVHGCPEPAGTCSRRRLAPSLAAPRDLWSRLGKRRRSRRLLAGELLAPRARRRRSAEAAATPSAGPVQSEAA